MTQAAFPDLRLRRTRRTAWSRAMVRETHLTPANLIWPLFVCDGSAAEEPIASLPGVSRWSVDGIVGRARDAVAAGIPCVALFPYTQPALFAMPIAFLMTFIVSKLDGSAQARAEIAAFEDQYVRAQTGFGAAGAAQH